MDEVDKRIAELVMGEPEPLPAGGEFLSTARIDAHDNIIYYSEDKNWYLWYRGGRGDFGWHPAKFSSDLDQAIRAVDKYLEDQPKDSRPILQMDYDASAKYPHEAYMLAKTGYGQTLPEAICNLLLALVKE